jgi:ATP-binding cassette subfamily B protein
MRSFLTQPNVDRESETRPFSMSLFTRLFRYTKPHAKTRNLLFVTVVLRAIQLPVAAWAIGAVIGGPVTRLNPTGIMLGALGYGAIVLLSNYTLRYRSRLAMDLGEDVVRDLRGEMFAHMQTMPMSFYNRERIGRLISRFTSDSESVRNGVQNVVFVGIVGIGQMIGASIFMLAYDATLFLLLAGLFPIVFGLHRYFSVRLSRAYRSLHESFSRVTATVAESVAGVRVTQGFVRENINSDMFDELVRDHSRYNLDSARYAGTLLPLLDFNTQLYTALVLLVGGYRVLAEVSNVEVLYQFIVMSGAFFNPIKNLGAQYNTALSAMAGAERIFKLLDGKPEWSDRPDARPMPPIEGRVEFRNVTFGYEAAKPVLHDISFACEPGQTIALVGPTGSGKTSIINLISKFYLPQEGTITIDGHDLNSVTGNSLHRQTGIVLQENFLFTGTILDNIRFGRPDATREDVVAAAKRLDCLDLIASLPDGFNTTVGEGGVGISLGQRQLICFARAMLANPRILLLDEATSSVDTMTEARIQSALEKLLSGRTSFVVAHRLSTIRHADRLLVINKGRIVESGTHDELLRQGDFYAELYREFARAASEEAAGIEAGK